MNRPLVINASLLLITLLLTACGIHKPFVTSHGASVVSPTTIAVVSGNTGEPSQRLADFLSQELIKRTNFKVMDQDEISRRVEKYPVNLAMVDAFEQNEPVWILPEHMTVLNKLQKRLKTEYIFVIWGHNLSFGPGGFTNAYSITSLGNMYRYPGGTPVAFTYDENERSVSFLGAFKGAGYDIDELLRDSSARIVTEMVKVMNEGKNGKRVE